MLPGPPAVEAWHLVDEVEYQAMSRVKCGKALVEERVVGILRIGGLARQRGERRIVGAQRFAPGISGGERPAAAHALLSAQFERLVPGHAVRRAAANRADLRVRIAPRQAGREKFAPVRLDDRISRVAFSR